MHPAQQAAFTSTATPRVLSTRNPSRFHTTHCISTSTTRRLVRKESRCLYSTSRRLPSLLGRSRHPGQPRVPDPWCKSAKWKSALRKVHRPRQGGYRAPRRVRGGVGTRRLSSRRLREPHRARIVVVHLRIREGDVAWRDGRD